MIYSSIPFAGKGGLTCSDVVNRAMEAIGRLAASEHHKAMRDLMCYGTGVVKHVPLDEWYRSHVLCDPVASVRKRYKDPPPAGVEPDPDYVPEEGEWAWVQRHGEWEHRHRRGYEMRWKSGWVSMRDYKDKMLPAHPPDAL